VNSKLALFLKGKGENMKIQYMAIIFLIIIVPMTLMLTIYNQSQIDNLNLQLTYKSYLSDATHNAIKAYELNTVNNSFSEVADSLKRDVEAAVNVFLTSMASNMGTSGATAQAVSEYVPAVLFTSYDGYYIYAPANVEELDVSGEGEENIAGVENFSHIVKPYVYYTMRYVEGSANDFIVNYTLDNYITVYGKVKGKYVTKSGYLLPLKKIGTEYKLNDVEVTIDKDKLLTVLKRDVLEFVLSPLSLNKDVTSQYIKTEFSNPKVNGESIDIKKYITEDYPTYATTLTTNMGKKLLDKVLNNDSNIKLSDITISKLQEKFEYKLDGMDEVLDCITVKYTGAAGTTNDDYVFNDRDAKLYYIKALQFSEWVNTNLSGIKISDAKDSKGNDLDEFKGNLTKIFDTINSENNPENLASPFAQHKNEVIKASIQSNLTASIARYNQQYFGATHGYDLRMPVLNDLEWEKIANNVTIVTFMQGVVLGNKVFNDYSIVSSENNKELVDANKIYYFDRALKGLAYYHKYDCPKLEGTDVVGFKSIEYEVYKEEKDKKTDYRLGKILEAELNRINLLRTRDEEKIKLLACYDCLVNCNYDSSSERSNELLWAKLEAMAREKNQHYKVNSYMETEMQ